MQLPVPEIVAPQVFERSWSALQLSRLVIYHLRLVSELRTYSAQPMKLVLFSFITGKRNTLPDKSIPIYHYYQCLAIPLLICMTPTLFKSNWL
jgi:hypothetical protein